VAGGPGQAAGTPGLVGGEQEGAAGAAAPPTGARVVQDGVKLGVPFAAAVVAGVGWEVAAGAADEVLGQASFTRLSYICRLHMSSTHRAEFRRSRPIGAGVAAE
jgi:hypothetical protein